MISYHKELKKILGEKYGGCTQMGDKLVEWRLKPGEVATEEELRQLGLLTMPHSTHLARLVAIDPSAVKPATVVRTWNGIEYTYNCFVTQSVADEYKAGKINVGDHVIVHFDDIGEQIVTAKVFKSWS